MVEVSAALNLKKPQAPSPLLKGTNANDQGQSPPPSGNELPKIQYNSDKFYLLVRTAVSPPSLS